MLLLEWVATKSLAVFIFKRTSSNRLDDIPTQFHRDRAWIFLLAIAARVHIDCRMPTILLSIPSNALAVVAALFGVLAAVTAWLSAIQAGHEMASAVQEAEASAGVKIAKVQSDARIKIAITDERAALALERAAKLEKEASEAKLQLARIAEGVGARRLSGPQKRAIIDAMQGKSTSFFVVDGAPSDAESTAYAEQIAETLEEAGMKRWKHPYPYTPLGILSGPGNPMMIYIPPSPNATATDLHDPLYNVLKQLFGSIGYSPWINGHQQAPYYFLQIGRRSAPNLK